MRRGSIGGLVVWSSGAPTMRADQPTSRPATSHRRGYTLYEVLLVLAILVLIAASSWPVLSWWFRDAALKQAAADVRVVLDETRMHAIDNAIHYEFRFEPGGRRFVSLPGEIPLDAAAAASGGTTPGMSSTFAGAGASGPAGTASAAGASPTVAYLYGQLPEGLTFPTTQPLGTTAVPLNPMMYGSLPEANDIAAAKWSAPILYCPDGTAADANLAIVTDDDHHAIRLTLRGLTGTVRTGDVFLEGTR